VVTGFDVTVRGFKDFLSESGEACQEIV
jgi:hypothetical protein